MESPAKAMRPNYVSLNEARFIVRVFGVEQLKKCNTAGPEGRNLREQYRAIIKEQDADHA
jgi:hypothetical protein